MFGLKNAALLEDFKKDILGRATGAPSVERNVAVSEIDFTECSQCTPSYRALPEFYMRHVCTERTEEEREVGSQHVQACWLLLGGFVCMVIVSGHSWLGLTPSVRCHRC